MSDANKIIRNALQEGYARNPISIIFAFIAVALFIFLISCGTIQPFKLANIFQFASAIAAILSTIACSLRNRSLDLYLKTLSIYQRPHDARKAGCTLTNLTFFSFITSLTNLLLSIFISCNLTIMDYILSSVCIFMSTVCAVQYVYVLFSFEKLENLIITNMALHYFHEDTKDSFNNIPLSNIKRASDPYPDEWKND